MRVAVAILTVVVTAVIGRFLWDDVISGEVIPRGVVVDGIAVGNTDRETASSRLAGLSPTGDLTLTFEGDSRTQSRAEWGIEIDVEATVDAAARTRGGGFVRFFRWTAAVVRDRSVDPVWRVDTDKLASHFGPDGIGLVFETSAIELVDGRFQPVERESLPIVDVPALEAALLAAVDDPAREITVPTTDGVEEVFGDTALADAANALTGTGLMVRLAGQLEVTTIGSEVLRKWLDVAGAVDPDDFRFSSERVQATLHERFPDAGVPGVEGVRFLIGFDGEVYLLGTLDGSECCADTSADRLFNALERDDDEPIVVFPEESDGARGLAWAHSLGIQELVGEFTTFYKPNQTRNTNIARISELTRGAVIEPGGTFSVNDYVGRRTTDNGFVPAGMISNGVFTNSVGGGISQYATTLFNAAFFAGLEFGEYQSHSIYLDRYPYGREATVSFPAPDLEIVNTTPYGILLWPTTNADSITVRLYSTAWARGEQTGQSRRPEGAACTRVTTERTRTWVDGRTEIDTVTARYRPEGIGCNGASTVPTTPTPTNTTIPTTVP